MDRRQDQRHGPQTQLLLVLLTCPSPLPRSGRPCCLVYLSTFHLSTWCSGSSDIPPVSVVYPLGLNSLSKQPYHPSLSFRLKLDYLLPPLPATSLSSDLILFPPHRKNYYGIPARLQELLETPPVVQPGD